MAKFATVGGITGVGFLAVGLGLPKVIEGLSPAISYGLAAFGAVLLVAAFVWSLLNKGDEDGGRITQDTSGPHSPNYGNVEGGVHNYYGPPNPAEKQERKSPHGSARYSWDNLASLERVMRAGPYGGRDRLPEMPVWLALHKIAGRIGDTNELDGFPEARRVFRQEARRGRVGVWGYEQIPPADLKDDRRRDLLERIDDYYWREYRLNPRAAKEEETGSAHTEEEELPSRREGRFWSLMVHASDINRCWPKLPQTKPDFWKDDDDDGTDWKTV